MKTTPSAYVDFHVNVLANAYQTLLEQRFYHWLRLRSNTE